MPSGIYIRTLEHLKNRSEWMRFLATGRTGAKHPSWKGEEATYSTKHKWIVRIAGKAYFCSFKDDTCTLKFEWSNISGKYKRDINDYQQLCASHHRRYDRFKPTPMYGSMNPKSKLTAKQVKQIREKYSKRSSNQYALAREYGVSQVSISNILNFRTWATKE